MKKSNFVWVALLAWGLSMLSVLVGCTKKDVAQREVHLATWSNYIAPELVQEFEKKTGIKILMSNYASNEELLAKLQAGASGYDVAIPSDYMVFVMAKLNLLTRLDFKAMPNAQFLNPDLTKRSYDPTNAVSVPFSWGTTGIAINRQIFKGQIKGWKDIFENKELAGNYTLLDDVRETLGAALKSLGYSLNSKNPTELAAAKALLLKIKPQVRGFTSEPQNQLVAGEIALAHAYSSDALRGRKKAEGKIDYLIPQEGCTLWIDNLVIPASAKHVKEAHELINFLLDQKSSLTTAINYYVVPAHKDALSLLPPETRNNPMIYPPKSDLVKCEMIEDLGEGLVAWDRIWTEVKTAN